MAGWRVGFLVGNAAIVQALTKLKSYLDYGTFQPIQIAAIVAMNEAPDYPKVINETYQARRDALCDGLNRIGWEITPPRGTMFVWAPIPEPYREMGSLEFSKFLVKEADVATSPGVGFGPGGDDHVRFALIENEQRIGQGVRSLRRPSPGCADPSATGDGLAGRPRGDGLGTRRPGGQGRPAPPTSTRACSIRPDAGPARPPTRCWSAR